MYGIWTIAPEENCPPVGVRVWLGLELVLGWGGGFSSGAIVLEPFCIVVINKQKYCFERKKWSAPSQKDNAFSPLLYLQKESNICLKHGRNQQKIMLILVITQSYFSVHVHNWEIQINLGSVVYSRTNDPLTFTLSNFLMAIVFRPATLSKRDSNTGFFLRILQTF